MRYLRKYFINNIFYQVITLKSDHHRGYFIQHVLKFLINVKIIKTDFKKNKIDQLLTI
ncbi:hypothetical protein P689_122105 [Candidatus Riesia pediculischaeffi PTSU]|uniref:Uncharacterized protein n=1 Tax=Candidatus Riesia pediculischaeffi PTSU TaxID=1401651 RepID=A0A0C1S9I6_9ENTR|nr:hypothetical protein P689_122105 [Candidatus Riesia pediculischaeffi PTSU]